MSFAAPAFLWALLAVPAVVVLHFLRTERTRREVAALFLWREARDAAEARRRFSPTWLLLVQVLFVTAAALALAQPRLSLQGAPDAVLVIDASASMAATETDGSTRLDLARAEALAVAGDLGRVAVVRAGLDAVLVHPFGGEDAELRDALTQLRAGDRIADLDRAIDLAQGIVGRGEIHVFTDGPVAPRDNLRVHPVGGSVQNFGIVAFDVGLQEAFVAVASNLDRPREVELTLSREGRPVASTSLFVPAGGQGTVTFPLSESGIYEARLSPPVEDALALDDVAFAGRAELVVVLDRPNEPLQRALVALPAVTVRVTRAAQNVDADVRVLTGADPDELAPGSYVVLAPPVAEPEYRVVRDVDQAHPLMRFVDLRGSVVGVGPDWPPADDDGDWTVLARDRSLEPLLRFRDAGDRRILQFGFHPSQTDIVLRPAFPALIANAVRAFRSDERIALGSALPAGSTLAGEPVDRAMEPGLYDVNGRVRAVSLLAAGETRLTAAPTDVAAPSERTESLAETTLRFAPWLLAVAVLALAAEWLLSRRTRWWALDRR